MQYKVATYVLILLAFISFSTSRPLDHGHYHQFHQDITTGQVKRIMYLRAFMLWYAFTGPAAPEEAGPFPRVKI